MADRYRHHLLDPRAYELADGSGWSAEVYVTWDDGPDTIDARFILKGQFPTRDAALTAASQTGKREVDKRIRSAEISSVIDRAVALPSTHRRGFGGPDDVAEGADGSPTKVNNADNPEDRFD